MKHKAVLKSVFAVLLITGVLSFNGKNAEADTTPSGTVGGTSVAGRSTCGSNNASSSTYTTPCDYGVLCDVSSNYYAEHSTTHASYNDNKYTYGYGSAGVAFVAPAAYVSQYVDASHSASKYGQTWPGHTHENYP